MARGGLFLARDQLGVKPLYYAQVGQGFLFGSEMKALLCCSELSREIDAYLADRSARLSSFGPAADPLRAARITSESLERFYAEVHDVVGELLYARNFYIALMSADGQLLEFPYIVDERDVVSRTRIARLLAGYRDRPAADDETQLMAVRLGRGDLAGQIPAHEIDGPERRGGAGDPRRRGRQTRSGRPSSCRRSPPRSAACPARDRCESIRL